MVSLIKLKTNVKSKLRVRLRDESCPLSFKVVEMKDFEAGK